ncbi:thioredoxin, mitochondrial [Stomoxys calcitrans]|uniref:Thioredoxin domain-containing protein n=1 Tax=Stomoxys calcitrans TaxID=35570 RepID=A0A1I8P4J4_STOCA|nr:thioredoxin, mitochondrial [Stomoxys calcitrans]XP_013110746.1 thioredoxin, mitochondrial [Stomoxys calcitrans]XP_013110747.1 thioredoxin, mitochondrial [Stomoxys calcitrans]
MLKIAAEGLMPSLVACIQASSSAQNACQRLAPLAVSATQKFLSQSQATNKKYTVKDHYEFDQKVINSDTPVIVNFHAEWCDPCKILTPKMIELLQDSNEIDLAIIDVESNTELVETFEVKAVPAVLAFRNGVVVDKFIGLVDANSIESLIDKLKSKNRSATETEAK